MINNERENSSAPFCKYRLYIQKFLNYKSTYVIFLALFSIFLLYYYSYHGRAVDIEIYRNAILNKTHLYTNSSGEFNGFYLSPFCALFLYPFMISPNFVFLFANVIIVICFCIYFSKKFEVNKYVLPIFFVLSKAVQGSLYHSNLSIITNILGFIAFFLCVSKNKKYLGILLLAISILLKPFAMIFLIVLFINRKYRECLFTILTCIPLLLLGLIFVGINNFIFYFKNFFKMTSYSGGSSINGVQSLKATFEAYHLPMILCSIIIVLLCLLVLTYYSFRFLNSTETVNNYILLQDILILFSVLALVFRNWQAHHYTFFILAMYLMVSKNKKVQVLWQVIVVIIASPLLYPWTVINYTHNFFLMRTTMFLNLFVCIFFSVKYIMFKKKQIRTNVN
jgi:hypothetical protein